MSLRITSIPDCTPRGLCLLKLWTAKEIRHIAQGPVSCVVDQGIHLKTFPMSEQCRFTGTDQPYYLSLEPGTSLHKVLYVLVRFLCEVSFPRISELQGTCCLQVQASAKVGIYRLSILAIPLSKESPPSRQF